MSINKTIVSGNLTRDPEIRATTKGTTVLSFTVAINDYANGEGRTSYLNCSMFGTRAEKISGYLSKGSKVAVVGKLREEKWEKNGEQKSRWVLLVDDIEFFSQAKKQEGLFEDEEIPF